MLVSDEIYCKRGVIYSVSLKTKLAREEIDVWHCHNCGTSANLQVHHWTYTRNPVLSIYCKSCHNKADGLRRWSKSLDIEITAPPNFDALRLACKAKAKLRRSRPEFARSAITYASKSEMREFFNLGKKKK
jgi:hypothetical protein